MASLLPALFAKYEALSAAGFPNSTIPPEYEDRVPEVSAGIQLYPPYVIFSLIPVDDLLDFESDGQESYRLTAIAFAASTSATTGQGQADQTIAAIRFNNQIVGNAAGFDNSASLPTLTDGVLLSILPTRPPAPSLAGKGREGALIYKTMMEWMVTVQRS